MILPLPFIAVIMFLVVAACTPQAPRALGTLEYDRITLPAPSAERIVSIEVREGQQVAAGSVLMTLETTRVAAQTAASQAQARQQREALAELEAGARSQQIRQARANLASAQAAARDTRAYYNRVAPLGRQKLVAAMDVDRARAAASQADAQVLAMQAALNDLLQGARQQQIAQGQAAVSAAQAQADAQQVLLDKLTIRAPRAGRIDSLPYKLGDQAPLGAALATLLVGEVPYARIYVPEQQRAHLKVGDVVGVQVEGQSTTWQGRVRMIRSEPSFTPYFALTGKDAARLSYLAEVELGHDAVNLAAGLPVTATFGAATSP